MPHTSRLRWRYPVESQKDWWDIWIALINQMDSDTYSAIEDPSLILRGGGVINLDTGTDELSWTSDLELVSTLTGAVVTIVAGVLTGFTDGQIAYVSVARPVAGNRTAIVQKADTLGDDRGKSFIALRKDDVLFMRNNVDQITPYSTTAPITLYVNSSSGSDITGDGSAAKPYATVDRAYQYFPHVIAHECKILVTGASFADGWPINIDPVYEGDGSLSVVGVGTPTVVSGPWTVTGVADLGVGGQRITVGAGGLGSDDSLCGQAIMILTGGHVGNAYSVVSNTDTTIDIVLVTDKVVNADTFNLVNPAVKIASDGADIVYHAHVVPPWDGVGFTSRNSRFAIHNIWLDFSASTSMVDIFQISETQGRGGVTLDFMRVDLPAAVYGGMTITDCSINRSGEPYSKDYVADGGTGIANLACWSRVGWTLTGAGDRSSLMLYAYGESYITDFVVKGTVTPYGSECHLNRAGFGRVRFYGSSRGRITVGLIEGKAGNAAVYIICPYVGLDGVHMEKGDVAVDMHSQGSLGLSGVTCDPAGITGSAVSISALCVVKAASALPNFIGASAGGDKAYKFTVDGGAVKSDTWPANYGSATDTKGAFVTRED